MQPLGLSEQESVEKAFYGMWRFLCQQDLSECQLPHAGPHAFEHLAHGLKLSLHWSWSGHLWLHQRGLPVCHPTRPTELEAPGRGPEVSWGAPWS